MVEKVCQYCGEKFRVPLHRKNTAKYHNKECKNKAQVGKNPWNKGKKTGQKPWNIGRKDLPAPWNKKTETIGDEKLCAKCGKWKKIDEYYKDKNRKDGCSCWCKRCDDKNRKRCIGNHREQHLKYHNKYYQENKNYIQDRMRKYREENREKVLEIKKKEYRKHREKYIQSFKKWAKENIEKRREIANRYMRKKRFDPMFVLNGNISRGIRRSLEDGKQGRHWGELVHFSLQELRAYLQKTMPEGYSWEDYLAGKLHLDHIIPISVFNFSKPEHIDFKRCWALDNLRILPMKENLKKGNKLNQPFQPSLALRI